MEGPIIGRGSFGVVKALFPMVDLLALQQILPKKLQLPANRLAEGIKVLPNNTYEFCGLPLCQPTRAVKIMNITGLNDASMIKENMHLLREISIGSWVDHPNIVKVSEIYTNGTKDISKLSNEVFNQQEFMCRLPEDCTEIYIVMENCSGGDLSSRSIPKEGKEEFIARMFVHVFRALSYLNTLGIAHRDVKPENFLWSSTDPNADIKVTDFGLANSPLHTIKTRAGTAYYVAPEIVKYAPRKEYSVKCDSWSAGIMMHMFLLGFCPFHAETDIKTLVRVANDEIDWHDPRYSLISPDALDLLRRLLVKDPSKRLSTTEALKHPWLSCVTFEVSHIPMTVEETTGVVDALTLFYRSPVIKQLALCLMVRQIKDSKIEEWRKRYLYLSMFCENEHFCVNINTVEKWLMCAHDDINDMECIHDQHVSNTSAIEGKDNNSDRKSQPRRRVSVRQSVLWKSVSRLNDILNNFNQHKISINFTEFLAAQMMRELSKRNDLIIDTFAGLHREIPGRRSVLIDSRDLKRLLNPMYQCSDEELEGILQQSELIAFCSNLKDLSMGEGSRLRVDQLFRGALSQEAKSEPVALGIDEFFALMKSPEDVESLSDMLAKHQDNACDGYVALKRRLVVSKLNEIDFYLSRQKRQRKTPSPASQQPGKSDAKSKVSTVSHTVSGVRG